MNVINVSRRDLSVKASKLRKNGLVPGNIFGGALQEPIAVQIDVAEVKKYLLNEHIGSRVELNLDGEKIPAQLKEKEINPIKNEMIHITFQALKAGQKVNSIVHISLENTDKLTDLLERMTLDIPYTSLPRHMIDTVSIDVDGLPVGTTVTVGDIKELQTGNLELQVPNDEIVFRIVERRAQAEEPADEPGEETAE